MAHGIRLEHRTPTPSSKESEENPTKSCKHEMWHLECDTLDWRNRDCKSFK